VPAIDPALYELEIGGLVNKPVTLSLAELQDPTRFPCALLPRAPARNL
jgi:sulfite oxidase